MDKNFFPALECVAINSTGFSPWHEVHVVAGCTENLSNTPLQSTVGLNAPKQDDYDRFQLFFVFFFFFVKRSKLRLH
jgi:hypothetical protein